MFGTAGAALSTAFEKNLRDKADKALGELKPLLDKLDKKDPAYAQKKEGLFKDALKNAVLSAAAPFERKLSAQEKIAKEVVKQVPALAASIQKELNALPANDPKWGEHAMGIINKHLVTAASNIALNAAKDPVLAADFGGNANKIRDLAMGLLQNFVQKPLVESAAKAAQGAPPPKP